MARTKDEENDIEIPSDGDENLGGEELIKKRQKKRKSKEEIKAERKVIFWTLLVIIIITLGFWLMPKIGSWMNGEPLKFDFPIDRNSENGEKPQPTKTEKKNYIEVTL